MQWFVFFGFQLQMTQQYLRDKTFGPAESPANSANLNTPIGAGTPTSVTRKRSKVLLRIATYIAIVALAIVAFVHQSRSSQLNNASPNAPVVAEETVSVIHPEKSQAATLQVPGQLSAYTDAPIYAQTSGYLKSWSFDIGAKVRANDSLGEIDTPEVDQALAQAKAQLQVDQSALQLAQVTYRRNQLLFEQKVLDAQTRDTAADTYHEDQAKLAADQANIDRLNALEAFKLLRAPFDGIVTARDVDVGAYVANGSGNQLFRVARTSPLRIYVNVPQRDAQLVKIGMVADLTLPQFPNRTFRAHVTNTAEALDPTSRSLLTQLQIPNESGELLPGAYAEVTLKFTDDRFLTIPENTLLFRREGPAVGIVHPDGKVEVRNITINRDFGNQLEISEGLSISDQVILNPSDNLTDGAGVGITEPSAHPATST
jgi:RND family efflux transporter MFP subunit